MKKYKVKISKFLKLFECHDHSMYYVIEMYMNGHYNIPAYYLSNALDHALYKMVKNIDRSKLAVDIFVAEPKFTTQCPTNLVKPEYTGFFIGAGGNFSGKRFFRLLKFAGVEEFTIKCNEDGSVDAEYEYLKVKHEVQD